MSDNQEGWAGDEDELQSPQADVGDGKDAVVAHVGAAGLKCVAHKVFAVVAPNALCGHDKHQHPEHKHHGEPNTTEGRGVLAHPAEEDLQSCPVHP